MENRSFSVGGKYRYGFNGKEKDEQGMGGGGSSYDYGFRIYNPALGKFLSVDPLLHIVAWNSTYCYAENDVISSIDLDGLEKYLVIYDYYSDEKTIKSIKIITVRKLVDGVKKEVDMNIYSTSDPDKMALSAGDDVLVFTKKGKENTFSHRNGLTEQEQAVYKLYMMRSPKVDSYKADGKELFFTHNMTGDVRSIDFYFADGYYGVEATCNYPLAKSVSSNNLLSFAILGTTPKTGGVAPDGKVNPSNGYVMMSLLPKEIRDLPSKIKEDGKIKSIDITLTSTLGTSVSETGAAEFKKGLENVGKELKAHLISSGIAADKINISTNVIRSDTKHENNVKITLKR